MRSRDRIHNSHPLSCETDDNSCAVGPEILWLNFGYTPATVVRGDDHHWLAQINVGGWRYGSITVEPEMSCNDTKGVLTNRTSDRDKKGHVTYRVFFRHSARIAT